MQLKLEEKGMHVNHERVYRVYREAGLLIRRKRRKHSRTGLQRRRVPRPAGLLQTFGHCEKKFLFVRTGHELHVDGEAFS